VAAHAHDLSALAHEHAFGDAGRGARQRALGWVVLLTLVTMVAELAAGWWTGSLALTADGWHMGTHALALGGAWLAYRLSARAGEGFAFGGWKIEVLAAYTSGLLLLAVALWIVFDALRRLWAPEPVQYLPALGVATIGLVVNLLSAWLLMRAEPGHAEHSEHPHAEHGHAHAHDHHPHDHHPHDHHDHDHHHGHGHDHNYQAALLHVLADALTSLLAIVALAGGALWGWGWLDAAVALVGAVVIARWAQGVLGRSARVLVDATADAELRAQIRRAVECDGDARVADLHVWQVGGQAWSAALSVVADAPLPAADYRRRLAPLARLRHVTVEVHRCPGCGA
jgi:cation diffusion facilitator family transporter